MSLKKDFISGIAKGTGMFVALISLGVVVVFAANWYDGFSAVTDEKLTIAKWNNMSKYLVPPGMIASFDRSCPSEWSEYLPARGRFLRGIDPTGNTIDPDGTRAVGSLQADIFKSHNHPFTDGADFRIGGGIGGAGIVPSTGIYMGTTNRAGVVGYSGSTETRPKNVAVIYCIKN
ncbi:MAG: hypothetical protein PHZ26_01905 [Candidatus Gracilibacteria bacterium]|nr:hypothetical protein [Candidatus Gracilibacteria bacterium]MDD2908489.1 hypothetical protein [Candidatus Gracilibacteria bacterium]